MITTHSIERIARPEARRLAEGEFERFAEMAADLTDDEWKMPTDCTAWDVRKLSLHVLGSADAQASVREFMHQMRRGMPLNKHIDSHHWVDGMNELQIREPRNALQRGPGRRAHGGWPESRERPLGYPAPVALRADPLRASSRLGASQVPPRRRLHP